MKDNVNIAVFFLVTCLAMTVFAVTGVNAQELNLPDSRPEPGEIGVADMPGEIAGYTPRSNIYRGTAGTIKSDVDVFMSVLDFNAVNMQNWFSYAGIDEKGVNLGGAVKIGSTYFGISYGGSLIDELIRRVTNQNILTLQKRDEIKKDSSGTSSVMGLVDSEGKKISGIATSENTVGLIFGAGNFGLKFGFGAYLEGREVEEDERYEHAFGSSLKPSLELGWNIPVGSVRTKLALRGAYDSRQYISKTGETFYYTSEETDNIIIKCSHIKKEAYRDFTEPSGGFTLGFGFGLGRNIRADVDLVGNAAFRIYKSNEQDGVMSTWEITDPVAAPQDPKYTDVTAPEIFDFRISGNPVFALTNDVSDRLTIGAKFSLAIGYDIFTISQSVNNFTFDEDGKKNNDPVSTAVKISDSYLSITPELGIGAKFMLWPDHFSMYAGFGIELFSYSNTVSARTTTLDGVDTEVTNTLRILELPATKITAGLTLNFTRDMTLDVLAITSGLDIDATKLTILLTLKK
jgi:hypothetical protein